MKTLSITSILLALVFLSGCSYQDYYSANNKNIQNFDSEIEERTAKYVLELNDHLMLVSSMAKLTKETTRANEIFAEAAELERTINRLQTQLKIKATMNRIALSSSLSKKLDERYNEFSDLKRSEMDKMFSETMARNLQDIVEKTNAYILDGGNVKIQQYSVQLKDQLEEVLGTYV